MVTLASSDVAEQVASSLLEIGAVKLRPQQPFTWASGWRSPIYCDNRVTLSYPALRSYLRENLFDALGQHFAWATYLAGVATAGIPMGAILADEAQLPFIYVRSAPKSHGMENLIEGHLASGAKVVLVEDLISTGGSALKAAHAVRNAGGEVAGMLALFTYGFQQASDAFHEANVPLITLCDYPTLVRVALDKKLISESDVALLSAWRENPSTWGQN